MMNYQDGLEANIHFLPTQFGGRQTAIFSGYRVQFYYDGNEGDVELKFINKNTVNPGDNVQAILSFLFPQNHVERLRGGDVFLLREGHKTVGFGQVSSKQ